VRKWLEAHRAPLFERHSVFHRMRPLSLARPKPTKAGYGRFVLSEYGRPYSYSGFDQALTTDRPGYLSDAPRTALARPLPRLCTRTGRARPSRAQSLL
jgi:hypothetical protein